MVNPGQAKQELKQIAVKLRGSTEFTRRVWLEGNLDLSIGDLARGVEYLGGRKRRRGPLSSEHAVVLYSYS